MPWKYDFWVTPEGTFEMGNHEHVDMALKALLRLDTATKIPPSWYFSQVPEKELRAAKKRGAPPADLEYLSRESNDPRTYMIVKYGWVRVARGKFNMNEFDDATLNLIQKAKKLWELEQPEQYEMAEIDELKGDKVFSVSVSKLRNRSASPEALKNMATGVGAFRNPESDYYVLVQMPRSGKWKVISNHRFQDDAEEAKTEAENMGSGYKVKIVRDDDPVVKEYLGE